MYPGYIVFHTYREERLKISSIDRGQCLIGSRVDRAQAVLVELRQTSRIADGVYKSAGLLEIFTFLFRVQSFHVGSALTRRQPPDGLNNRRRENEVEGKKRGGEAGGNPASRLLRDTSRYRRSRC